MFSARAGRSLGRRRTAPKAEETSDVRRFRGVLWASVAAALAVLVAMVVTIDPATERAPGPLSQSHQAAATCASCHVDDQPMASRCASCHEPHPSARAGHRRLAGAGTLVCTSCHPAHAGHGGVSFTPSGTVWRFGPGAQEEVKGLRVVPKPAKEKRVPIVPVERCAKCHDPTSREDPIAACLLADQQELGGSRPTVCFDEHRAFGGVAFSRGEGVYARSRLWAAAREVAAVSPVAPVAPAKEQSAWWWLGLAALTGAVAWGTARGVARLVRWRRRPRVAAAAAVQPPKIKRLPQIDTTTCIGCHACVDACPYDEIGRAHV